jgi:integrase
MSGRKQVPLRSKVQALAERPGSSGEQQAAEAALERLALAVPFKKTDAGGRLTDATIRRLPTPASGQKITWDSDPPGFGVRVTAAGSRSFIFNYRVRGSGQERRQTIGGFPSWSTGAARTEARRLRRLVDLGQDPRGEIAEERGAPTVFDLIDRFEREFLPRKRPATQTAYARNIRLHIKPHFGPHKKVADVTFGDVDRLHAKITASGTPYMANRCHAVVSKLFVLAIRWQMRTDNPARGVEHNYEEKRKRYMQGDELPRLMAALAETPDRQFANIILLLILTGARRGEVQAMQWGHLDLKRGVWSKPAEMVKQKRDHIIPLSQAALDVLKSIKPGKSPWVFPSTESASGHRAELKKGWAALLKRAGIEGLRLHDLRHSFASQLVSSDASLPMVGALLGHSNVSTTQRYSHLFDDPLRKAVEQVGAVVIGNGGGHDK